MQNKEQKQKTTAKEMVKGVTQKVMTINSCSKGSPTKNYYIDSTDRVLDTIWITKYWETMGLVESVLVRDKYGDLIVHTGTRDLRCIRFLPLREYADWFRNRGDAIEYVRNSLLSAKEHYHDVYLCNIAPLDKLLKKLERFNDG